MVEFSSNKKECEEPPPDEEEEGDYFLDELLAEKEMENLAQKAEEDPETHINEEEEGEFYVLNTIEPKYPIEKDEVPESDYESEESIKINSLSYVREDDKGTLKHVRVEQYKLAIKEMKANITSYSYINKEQSE